MTSRIKTTVVGSYPVLPWMVGNPSRLVVRDAVMAVLKTQELAGLDLVTDGELMRFDPSHPETNGMVDYFVSQMDGIRRTVSPFDSERYRADRAAGYLALTGATVVSKIGDGTLNLPRDCEFARRLTRLPFKFTSTGPHMLARLLNNTYYPDLPDLAMDIAAVLRRQLELVDADTVQLDEASIAGFPQDARWAAEAINHVLDGILSEKAVHICFGNYGGQPMLTGFWRDLIPFLNSLHADHLVLEFARRGYDELDGLLRSRSEDRPGHRRDRHQGQRSREPGAHRRADRAHREDDRRAAAPIRPPRLRLLDAAAQRRRPQDSRARGRARSLRGPAVSASHDAGRVHFRR